MLTSSTNKTSPGVASSTDCKKKSTNIVTIVFAVFRSEEKIERFAVASVQEVIAVRLEMRLSTSLSLGVELPLLNSISDY